MRLFQMLLHTKSISVKFIHNLECITDSIYVIAFRLIQSLLPPSRISTKKGNPSSSANVQNKARFYTVNESRNAFLLICSTESGYKEMYDSRVKEESCVAPYISLIGTIFEPQYLLVDFENITYKIFDFARALDVCFKAYYVFNIAYPDKCADMWDFINQQFSKMQDKSNKSKTKPSTFTLLAEIKSM